MAWVIRLGENRSIEASSFIRMAEPGASERTARMA